MEFRVGDVVKKIKSHYINSVEINSVGVIVGISEFKNFIRVRYFNGKIVYNDKDGLELISRNENV